MFTTMRTEINGSMNSMFVYKKMQVLVISEYMKHHFQLEDRTMVMNLQDKSQNFSLEK